MRSLLIFTLIILSGNPKKGVSQIRTSTREDAEVVKLIGTLPEVEAANNYVKKHSKGQRHLITYIDRWPSKKQDYFWVRVAEDNGSMLVTHFNFYVARKNHSIRYFSILQNKGISLNIWRKMDKRKFY